MTAKPEYYPESSDQQNGLPNKQPLFLRQLSPEMLALLDKHFWCDFGDMIPSMTWDDKNTPKQ